MAGRYRSLLANATYLKLTTAGSLSFGAPTAVVIVLIGSIVHAYPGSLPDSTSFIALALAFLGLSATVPTIAAAIVSGTLADRTNRLRLMRAVNVAGILAVLGMIAVVLFSPSTAVALPGPAGFFVPAWVLFLFPLYATLTVSTTLFRPALNAAYPSFVSKEDLGRASGVVSGSSIAVLTVGSISSGALLDTWGASVALLLPFGLLLGAQVALTMAAARQFVPPDRPLRSFLHEAREGYVYIWRRRELFQITVTALAINFLVALAMVELGLYVHSWLGLGPTIYFAALLTGASLGSAVGALGINLVRFEHRAGRLLAVLTLLLGVSVLAFALIRSFWLALVDAFIFGMFPGMYTTVYLATIQATVPSEILGRVLAADEVGSYSFTPIGQYVGGLVTVAEGIQFTYLAGGVGVVAVGLVMASLPQLRKFAFDSRPSTGPLRRDPVPGPSDPPPGAVM